MRVMMIVIMAVIVIVRMHMRERSAVTVSLKRAGQGLALGRVINQRRPHVLRCQTVNPGRPRPTTSTFNAHN